MESYLQETFGSGTFEVGLYDESNSELGRYRYYIGGASEYIHTPKASDDEDSEPKDPAVELVHDAIARTLLGRRRFFLGRR